jgi:protein TonB
MVRFLVSILLGAAVTFTLFTFMAFLISSSDRGNNDVLEDIIVEVNTTPPASQAAKRRTPPPPPPPPPPTPPKVPVDIPDVNTATTGISFSLPGVILTGGTGGISGPVGLNKDGDATPIVRIDPKYPAQAAKKGITGWVKLSFTINKLGAVEDVTVLEAQPRRVFDKEAKRALRKWKYKPKLLDGKALRQSGLTVQLDFNMEGG